MKPRPRYDDFSIFQNGGRRHVVFLKLQISNCGMHHKCRMRHHAKFRGDPSNRCRDISILFFSDEGSHHLGSLKFYIFNDRKGQEGRNASLCQILSKSLKPWRRYVSFLFSRWRLSPSWISKFQFFNGRNAQEGRTASACQILSKYF